MAAGFSKLQNISLVLLLSVTCTTYVSAADYFADAALSFKRLDFKAQSSDGSTNYRLSPLFAMLSVTGGMVINKMYITASIENSLIDSDLDTATYSDSLSRSDSSLTFGYYIKNNLSIFGGYLTGDTKDNYTASNANNETGTISFSEEGLFFGANYIVLLSPGALSLNLAYAFLDGEYELNYTDDIGSRTRNHKGDTSGISMGLKYIAQWKKQINYFLGGKINLFKFDSASFDTQEKFFIVQTGLSYKFAH